MLPAVHVEGWGRWRLSVSLVRFYIRENFSKCGIGVARQSAPFLAYVLPTFTFHGTMIPPPDGNTLVPTYYWIISSFRERHTRHPKLLTIVLIHNVESRGGGQERVSDDFEFWFGIGVGGWCGRCRCYTWRQRDSLSIVVLLRRTASTFNLSTNISYVSFRLDLETRHSLPKNTILQSSITQLPSH